MSEVLLIHQDRIFSEVLGQFFNGLFSETKFRYENRILPIELRLNYEKIDVFIISYKLIELSSFRIIEEIKNQKPSATIVAIQCPTESIKLLSLKRIKALNEDIGIIGLSKIIGKSLNIFTENDIVNEMKNINEGKVNNVFNNFSKREKEVVNKLMQGLETKEIARELNMAEATVNSNVYRARGKADVKTTNQLMVLLALDKMINNKLAK